MDDDLQFEPEEEEKIDSTGDSLENLHRRRITHRKMTAYTNPKSLFNCTCGK
jgi:hypothetical protein